MSPMSPTTSLTSLTTMTTMTTRRTTLAPITPRPPARLLSARAAEIVAAARRVLEAEGAEAVTMRRLGDELGMRAPSLYKHFANKQAVEAVVIEQALTEAGVLSHAAVARPGVDGPVASLLRAYRRYCVAHPHLYRLVTGGSAFRESLTPTLEDWAGEPWLLATGDPHRGQALWAFAHGMVVLEIDNRFVEASDLDRTWASGAEAFG